MVGAIDVFSCLALGRGELLHRALFDNWLRYSVDLEAFPLTLGGCVLLFSQRRYGRAVRNANGEREPSI